MNYFTLWFLRRAGTLCRRRKAAAAERRFVVTVPQSRPAHADMPAANHADTAMDGPGLACHEPVSSRAA